MRPEAGRNLNGKVNIMNVMYMEYLAKQEAMKAEVKASAKPIPVIKVQVNPKGKDLRGIRDFGAESANKQAYGYSPYKAC